MIPWGVPHDHIAVASVIALPEGKTDVQIRRPADRIEAGMGRHPALSPDGRRQGCKPLYPLLTAAMPQLAVGVTASQEAERITLAVHKGLQKLLFVVAHQPHPAAAAHEPPGELHGVFDRRPPVDHIPQEHQPVAGGQKADELPQGLGTAMDIADDPMARGGVGGKHARGLVPPSLAREGLSCHLQRIARASICGYRAPNISWGNAGDTMNNPQQSAVPDGPPDLRSLPTTQRVGLLVKALNGARRTNEALARCSDGEAMLDVLLDASQRLGLGLTRNELRDTPPIRDWIWWKNKEAVLTIGDAKPRYQQDGGQGRLPNPSQTAGEGTAPRKKVFGLF